MVFRRPLQSVIVQRLALSRRKQGFDSPRGRQGLVPSFGNFRAYSAAMTDIGAGTKAALSAILRSCKELEWLRAPPSPTQRPGLCRRAGLPRRQDRAGSPDHSDAVPFDGNYILHRRSPNPPAGSLGLLSSTESGSRGFAGARARIPTATWSAGRNP